MLLVIRWGLGIAVLSSVVATLLLLQFLGPFGALLSVLFAPLGLALGWGVRRGVGARLTILAGAAAFLCATIAVIVMSLAVIHQDPVEVSIQSMVRASQLTLPVMQRLGAPPQTIEEMRGLWESYCSEHQCFAAVGPSMMRAALPVGLALSALLWAYLCYTVARSILRRVGHELPGVPPLLAWRLNPLLASVFVWSAAGGTLLSLEYRPAAGLALNAVIAALLVFAFQGALVGITWMNRWRISRFAQVMAGILMLQLAGGALAALAVLGLLDTWFDYRRLEGSPVPISPVSQPPAGRVGDDQARGARARKESSKTGGRVEVVRPR